MHVTYTRSTEINSNNPKGESSPPVLCVFNEVISPWQACTQGPEVELGSLEDRKFQLSRTRVVMGKLTLIWIRWGTYNKMEELMKRRHKTYNESEADNKKTKKKQGSKKGN